MKEKLEKLKKKVGKHAKKMGKKESKRKSKAIDKEDVKKSVKFCADNDIIESDERKWNDFKGRKAFAVMGTFTKEEIRLINEAIDHYKSANNIEKEDFDLMCTMSANELDQ